MKKVLAILLTLCMVMGMMPVGVIAADEPAAQTVTEDTADLLWEYETYGDGVALTAYLGSSTDVYVPSKIEVNGSSYAVIKLGDSLFEDNDALNSVTLGDGITEIGARAFYDADNLVTIVTDEQLTAIGTEAFYSCDSFNSVILYDTVTSIGEDAFAECPNLTVWCNEGTAGYTYAVENSIPYEILNPDATPETYVQDGITYYIMNGEAIAIDFDESTTEVTVPATVEGYPVTELRETFRNCHDLVSVVLPDDLKKIGERTFYECYSLENVNIPYGIDRIDNYTFYSCLALERIILPDSVKYILDYAFSMCSSLTDINLPEGITDIDVGAFSYCSSLKSIEVPDSVVEMEGSVFCFCESLESIRFPKGETTVGSSLFSNCTSLKNVELHDAVDTIGANAFKGCVSLRSIYIPESVTYFGGDANNRPFSESLVLVVHEGSKAHDHATVIKYLYFIIRKTENPEISFGTGLSGTVTYTDGTPAVGANVEIIYDDGVSKETVVTDENGAYEFTYAEVGAYTIRATDAEGNTFTTPVSVKRMNAFDVFVEGDTALTLKKGYKVSGTVSAGGATVTVTDGDANVITSVTADENGNFVIENLPNGTYVFTATTEQGSASAEVTVYNGEVSDITLTIATDTVTLWGYVEVEDRDLKHDRRNWVEITVYNDEGIAVAQTKSDGDGKYTFSGLPTGEYSIVAETAEMRSDKKHGFDRSFTLTGYAYVSALTAGEYEVDTIVLYEENDKTATIEGKVTANGQGNASEVRLVNVFRHEVARMTTKSNGKYSFKNVKDGLYYIIATTENDGMGMAVITVRDGKVYGQTDIKVLKSDKIKDREDRFRNDIPDMDERDGIHAYRERIADEKRFYDGLSEKEKKQLSRDYVERLNKYCEWLAGTEYISDEGVSVEGGGLILSGDELEGEDTVSFNLSVEKKDAHNASTDGVHGRDDHIHHKMHDTAGKKDIVQYYEITMSKTVDGEDKAITSVYKDTDATGKFRITIEIPEEYRGHAQYTMLHEHHGEVVTLADLDDDPNTITVEVDRFSTFALAATDESNIGEVGAEMGDANADGVINVIDMTLTARYIAQGGVSGTYDLSSCDVDAMDANSDGTIDQFDLNALGAAIRANA